MKKIILLLTFFLLVFSFSEKVFAAPYVTLEGLDVTYSPGGSFNSGDPNFSTGPITIDYNGNVVFKWWGQEVDTCNSNITSMNQAYFDRHYGTFHTFGAQFGSGGTVTEKGIKQTKTFFITCNGLTASVQIIVRPPQLPLVTLTANPNLVEYDGDTNLVWTSTNSDSCTASGGWNGAKSTSGNQTISNLKTNTTFTITCIGPAGNGSANATVTVKAKPLPPTVTLSATPKNINSGGATQLTWTVTGTVTDCIATSNPNSLWNGSKSTSGGSQIVSNITLNTIFNLSCTGPGGNANGSVAVTINPLAPSVNISALPSSISKNGGTKLTWSVTNANSCTASNDQGILAWTGSKDKTSGEENISNIASNVTFNLSCTGPGGSSEASTSVNVFDKPTVSLNASKLQVNKGETTKLTWIVSNANSCTASAVPSHNIWKNGRNVAGGSQDVVVTKNTVFKIDCSSPGGNASSEVSITVINLKPEVTLNATPLNVNYDAPTQLTWSVKYANSCTASGGWSGAKSTSGGNQITNKLTTNTIFTLTCIGDGGSTVVNTEVTVNPDKPSINFLANPIKISKNGGTKLTWSVTNANSCTASNDQGILAWTGSKDKTSGEENISNIASNVTFNLSCTGPGGSSEASKTVEVFPIPTVSLTVNKNTVVAGDSVILTWSVTNANSCTAGVDWSGNKNKDGGSETISNITSNKNFSISCNSDYGVANSSATVSLIPEKLTFNNTKVLRDSTTGEYKTTLSWVLTNMTNCTASTKNPENGLNWGGSIPDSPVSNSKSNVLVKAADTNNKNEKNEYILSCFGKNSGKAASASLFLDINDLSSSGSGVPDYEEN